MAFGVDLTVVQLGDENHRVEARGKFTDKDAQDYVLSAESEQLLVEVPSFEGPLDLLLHLIKKHSMDIFDIPIVEITKQYLDALDQMQTLNLDLAGEFLLMAATLTQIKSKMLLPPEEQAAQSEEEDGEPVDPRAELMRRLLEYQRYKEVAAGLKQIYGVGADSFYRQTDDWSVVSEEHRLKEGEDVPLALVEVYELIQIFSKAIENAKPQFGHAVQFEKISVRARISELIEWTRVRLKYDFQDALSFFQVKTKIDLIVTFLAILEMARMKLIRIEQDFQTQSIALQALEENLSVIDADLFDDLGESEGEDNG